MNTATAASHAGVTTATITKWCRIGAVAAIKQAGRWIIDTASLANRIAIGTYRRRRTMTAQPTATLVALRRGYGLRGDAAALAAALESGTPVTLDNAEYAGELVHIGYTQETIGGYGRTLETKGLAYTKDNGQAVYHANLDRLEKAPRLAAALQQVEDELDAAEARMYAHDEDYLNPRYM